MKKKNLIEKASAPLKAALKRHSFYKGKIEISLKCPVTNIKDFAVWYTPGVGEPVKAIQKDKSLSYEYTNRGNTIAVITDGTRVLGLGDTGPEAAMPVMEGKSLIFKYLGGVDAVPICLGTKDVEEIVKTVKILRPNFAGINLEDISSPKCFEILDKLKEEMDSPVWHDDQQGTAAVTLAGLINALHITGKDIGKVRIALVGAGASNIRIANLLIKYGADPGKIIMADSRGTLHKGREDIKKENRYKWELALKTNKDNLRGTTKDMAAGADVMIALSAPGPDTIKKEWISSMAKDAIVFACANPVPEIWPWEAKEAGAKIVATGRSDFDNQVNNSLGFPGIFRGVLEVRATDITDEMCIAASEALAGYARNQGINPDYILPSMDDVEVFAEEAAAVGVKAIEQGVALKEMSYEKIYSNALKSIKRAQKQAALMVENNIVKLEEEDSNLK